MLHRIRAVIIKEYLILIRDKSGLAVLYVMPLVLVFLMVFIQDPTFHELQDIQIEVLCLNEDKGTIGSALEDRLSESDFLDVQENTSGPQLTKRNIMQAVFDGRYKAGIYIPENFSATVQSILTKNEQSIQTDSLRSLILFFDPAASPSMRNIIRTTVREKIARVEMQLLLNQVRDQLNAYGPQVADLFQAPDSELVAQGMIYLKEKSGQYIANEQAPNSVQHNVPAWSLFAMFFIVIPLAGSMIQERDEGNLRRLMTTPLKYMELLSGKLVVYYIVCLTQFMLMLGVGIYLMPVLGFSEFNSGTHPGHMLLFVSVVSMAATGYGILIGSFARTQQQASSFGAISVIIAAALGGIWVPVFIMPDIIQQISSFSPLAWGLNGFHEVFLRNADLMKLLPNMLSLSAFFIFTIILSVYKFSRTHE